MDLGFSDDKHAGVKAMKKTILMLLLVAMSTGAMVEWEKTLDGSDDAGLQVSPGTAV